MCGLYILDSGMFVWGVVFHMQNTGYVCKIQLCFALVLFFLFVVALLLALFSHTSKIIDLLHTTFYETLFWRL